MDSNTLSGDYSSQGTRLSAILTIDEMERQAKRLLEEKSDIQLSLNRANTSLRNIRAQGDFMRGLTAGMDGMISYNNSINSSTIVLEDTVTKMNDFITKAKEAADTLASTSAFIPGAAAGAGAITGGSTGTTGGSNTENASSSNLTPKSVEDIQKDLAWKPIGDGNGTSSPTQSSSAVDSFMPGYEAEYGNTTPTASQGAAIDTATDFANSGSSGESGGYQHAYSGNTDVEK